MSPIVLFLCTGNYYRSRFAEILFNHLAKREGLPWRAVSRGLKIGWPGNVGPLSVHTAAKCVELGINCETMTQMPVQVRQRDLESASMVIALKEAEHRPMLAKDFPGWEDRVTYWHVHDVQDASPAEALAAIETLVRELANQLAAGSPVGISTPAGKPAAR